MIVPKWLFAGSLLLISVFLAACDSSAVVSSTQAPFPTFTPGPTQIPARPTDPPPGSEENPLNLLVVASGSASNYVGEVTAINQALTETAGVNVEVRVVNDYAEVLEGLCNRTVHMGTLDAFSYLAASQRGCVTLVSVVERDGETEVQGALVANRERLINNVESFRGRRFCRPEAQSVYGWLIPSVTLRARGIDPLNELNSVVNAGSDKDVLQKIHDNECDVGATLLDAADDVDDLENPGRITFIETLTAVPNDVVVFGVAVNEPLRVASLEAFDSVEGELADILDAENLRVARDADYDELRELFASAGIDVVALGR